MSIIKFIGLVLIWSICCVAVQAQEITFTAPSFHCVSAGGTPSRRTCRADYAPYKGNACAVYKSAPEHNARQDVLMNRSCSPSEQLEAKRGTLEQRVKLMDYVTPGGDTSVNDPVQTPGFTPQPGNSSYWSHMLYFAQECSIQQCGRSNSGNVAEKSDNLEDGAKPSPTPSPKPRPIEPPAKEQPERKYTVKLCSNADTLINVSIIMLENLTDEHLTVSGWQTIYPGQCSNFSGSLGRYSSLPFYYYVLEYPPDWEGDARLCIPHKRGFKRLAKPGYQCKSDETVSDFTKIDLGEGENLIYLPPSSATPLPQN